MDCKQKVFWVTGASSGIGKAICLALDKKGARLILSARNGERLNDVLQSCTNPGLHRILTFDLACLSQIDQIVNQAWGFNERIDVLVNNAGISQRSLATETDLAVDRKVMEIDYFAAVALTRAVVLKMQQLKVGKIINITSIAGKVGSPMRSAYSGAKHALIGFMDCLRAEVVHDGIDVINICPGFVKTNISRNALTGDLSPYNKLDKEIENGMPTDKFVEILLKKLKSTNSEIVIAKGLPRLAYHLRRLFPNFYHWALPKIYYRHR